jgi:UDP-N-acetylmuramoylalanine--D-glutamate ligase
MTTMELPSLVAVLGLGVSGCAVAEVLLRRGIQVIAADEKPLEKLAQRERVQALAQQGAQLLLGGDAFERLRKWRLPLAILSPGINLRHPQICALAQNGTTLWGEIEFAYRLMPTHWRIVAVTGTKGKTTTAHLIFAMLQASNIPSVLAGNVGTPFVQVVTAHDPTPLTVVLEVSSFQLATCQTFRPNIGALTMLGVDHLNWHETVDDYWRAKAKLFAHQKGDDWAVLNADDANSQWMAQFVRTRILWCGAELLASCPYCTHWVSNDEQFVWANLGEGRFPVARLADFSLPGEHNRSNLRIAIGAALLAGALPDRIADALREFRGVPHRLEFVAEVDGVRFYDDSAATTPAATVAALKTFDRPVILIAGGRDKGGDWSEFARLAKTHLKALIAIGEFADPLMAMAQQAGVPVIAKANDMDEAVERAASLAQKGDIVLLSPGCASYGMFVNCEERGETFKAAVQRLAALK